MNPLAPKHLVAARQRVVRTVDGTATPVVWTTIGNGPLASATPCAMWNSVTAATEAPNNSNIIYAVTSYDTVFVTQNANAGQGAVWNRVTTQNHPGGISTVKVDPTDYHTAHLASDSGVYKTTDTGAPWIHPDLIYRDVAIDGGDMSENVSEGYPQAWVRSACSF